MNEGSRFILVMQNRELAGDPGYEMNVPNVFEMDKLTFDLIYN